MGIRQVKVRASINIGNIDVVTPYILSFSVNKARGQISTFSAKLKVEGSVVASTAIKEYVKIKAGVGGASNTIFSGIIIQVSISPCWDDPNFVIMDVSGADCIHLLQGKKYTRRVTADTASWVSIDGVARRGVRGGKFRAKMAGKTDTVHSDILDEGRATVTAPLADVGKISMVPVGDSKRSMAMAASAKPKTSSTA
jgi:hypothetical protein